jgi:hypothetical protein
MNDLGYRIKKTRNESRRVITEFLDSHLVGTKQVNSSGVGINYQKAWEDLESGELSYKDAESVFSYNASISDVRPEYIGLFVTNRTKYLYQVEQSEINAVDQLIARIVNQFMMDGQGLWSPQWYLNQFIYPAWETGASESLQSLQNISPAVVVGQEISTEIRGLDIQNLLMTPAYRRPIELLSSRTFNSMEGLSGDMVKDLRFILSQSVADGISASDAAKRINAKLWPEKGGYKFRAERIARTEINAAYRQAYLEVNDDMNENVFDKGGFKSMVMHISALTATTRFDHASRHGSVFTSDQEAEWWSIGSNSINCLCSVTSVLVDKKTGEVLQQGLYKKALEQGEKYFAARA